jgi:dTDP-4-amino-4,6-dideoxy-D-galactose acyltransferase
MSAPTGIGSAHVLPWDSEFFGLKIARLDGPDLSPSALRERLTALRSDEVKLVYWAASGELDATTAHGLGGRLVDRKTTFVSDLRALPRIEAVGVESLGAISSPIPPSVLEDLAVQAGEFSRFAIDPRIPQERFATLYRIWMRRSLSGELAREVLVAREADRVMGFVTVGEKGEQADIGLLAVGVDFRGRGLGRSLVRAAQAWGQSQGFDFGRVVTQGNNHAGCKVYESCGYAVSSVDFFYHFWL